MDPLKGSLERLATEFPDRWTIRCGAGDRDTGIFDVVIADADGTEYASERFEHGRLDHVAAFISATLADDRGAFARLTNGA